jgi:hypothetical protein
VRLVCASVLLVACGTGGPAQDGGADADASSHPEATPADGNVDVLSDASVVAQCQTMAQGFAALCGGDVVRQCFWNGYAQLCETGYAVLLLNSMGCLDATSCAAFSDPSAAPCLANVHKFDESNASKSFVQGVCNACGNPCPNIGGAAEVIPYLTAADISKLSSCAGSACTIDDVIKACASSIPDVGYFASCVTDQ